MAARPGQMSNSRTMPQLNYTQADIQEQYLANCVRVPANGQSRPTPPATSADQNQSVRWRRTQQLAKFDDGGSLEDGRQRSASGQSQGIDGNPASSERFGSNANQVGGDQTAPDEQPETLEPSGGRRRTPKSKQLADGDEPKRKRRSRSASRLLSACLHIPAQLANSIASHHNQNQSSSNQRPHSSRASSILAHFRIGHNQQDGSNNQQRNARVVSGGENELPDDELEYSKQRPNEFRRPISSSRTLGDLQSLDSPAGSQSGRLKHVSFGEHQRQQKLVASSSGPTTTTTKTASTSSAAQARQDNVISSNIRGSSRHQNQTSGQSMVMQHQQPAGIANSQGRLAQPVPITGQPQSGQIINSSRLQQQQLQGNHQINMRRQQAQPQPPQATIYKRLPNIPMRTQATQTEITAYHLMQSPSGVSSAGSSSLAGTMTRQPLSSSTGGARTNQEDDDDENPHHHEQPLQRLQQRPSAGGRTADTPSSSLGSAATATLAPMTSASSNQLVASPEKSINAGQSAKSECRNLSPAGLEALATRPAADQRRDDQPEANENENADEDELGLGQSLQASLLDSASNSSSSVSLVGHDSALADTLKCELRIGTESLVKLAGDGLSRPMISAEQPAASSARPNRRASIIEPAGQAAAAAAASVTSAATNEMRNNRELEHEIEPPSRFKDETRSSPRRRQPSIQQQQQPMPPPPAGLRNEQQRQQMDESDHESDDDDDEARTSPPSLSEASSQTDPSMANAHMLNRIGRALERQASRAAAAAATAEGKRRSSTAGPNSTAEVLQQRRRQISIDNGRLASGPMRRPSGTREAARVEAVARTTTERARQEPPQAAELPQDPNAYATEPKSLYQLEPITGVGSALSSEITSTATSNLCSEVLQRRDQFLTGSPALSSSQELARSDKATRLNDTAARCTDLDQTAATPTNGADLPKLDDDELLAIPAELADAADSDEGLAIVEELQPVQLAVSQAIVERVRPPSSTTSTLSTRHHSYCSTDDFHESHRSELAEGEFGPIAGAAEASDLAAATGERLPHIQPDCEPDDDGDEEQQRQEENMPTIGIPDEASKVAAPFAGPASELVASAARKEEREPPAAKQRDESEISSSSSCASNQTLKSVVVVPSALRAASASTAAATAATAAGPNKSLEAAAEQTLDQGHNGNSNDDDDEGERQICSVVSRRPQQSGAINLMTAAATETEQTANKTRTPPRSSCSTSSFSSSSSGESEPTQASSAPEEAPDEPTAHNQRPPAILDLPSCSSHPQGGGTESKALAEPKTTSSLSPPTTVSDLDQDEELSTPSFVDSYKRRLEDHVNELADSFTSSLLGECLESVEIAAAGAVACNKSGFEGAQNCDEVGRSNQNAAKNSDLDDDDDELRANEAEAAREEAQAVASTAVSVVGETSRTRSRSTSGSSASAANVSSSPSATTTTSAGGSSYVRLEGGQVKRRSSVTGPSEISQEVGQQQPVRAIALTATTKPELPRKPAHLAGGILGPDLEPERADHRDERATAVAITASSIAAAAAALHANGRPSQEQGRTATMRTPSMANDDDDDEKMESRRSQSSGAVHQEAHWAPSRSRATVRLGSSDQSSGDNEGDDNNDNDDNNNSQRRSPPPSSSTVELATLSEASGNEEDVDKDEAQKFLEQHHGQQQQADLEPPDSTRRVQEIRPTSSSQTRTKPVGLIRQVSAASASESKLAPESGASANRLLRHSLSERSGSWQHSAPTGKTATIGNGQAARSTPTPPRTPTPPPPNVDCPFVASSTGLGRISSADKKQTALGDFGAETPNFPVIASKRTLSHDDTMEAIEDDVEGEEKEMKLLDELQNQQRPLGVSTPPVAPASSSPPLHQSRRDVSQRDSISALGVHNPIAGQSIQEEEPEEEKATNQCDAVDGGQELVTGDVRELVGRVSEEEDDDDSGDEESSISVSKEHGVVVESSSSRHRSRAIRANASKSGIKMKRFKKSSSNSDSSSPTSSARATPVASDTADDGSQPSTPTAGSATNATSDDSTKTGSPAHPKRAAREPEDRSDKSESQCELLIGETTSKHLVDEMAVDEVCEESDQKGTNQTNIEDDSVDAAKTSCQPREPATSSESNLEGSTESATHVILEHLSRHQRPAVSRVMGLDEPAPSLELYRSLEPLQRQQQQQLASCLPDESEQSQPSITTNSSAEILRASSQSELELVSATKQEADSTRVPSSQEQTIDEDQDDWTNSAMSPNRTGTMKRRRQREPDTTGQEIGQTTTTAATADLTGGETPQPSQNAPDKSATSTAGQFKPQSATDVISKRRPPLSELKCPAANKNEHSNSLDRTEMDNSICSSCSCMETSLDQTAANREPMAQISEQTASTSKQAEHQANQQQVQKRDAAASWISQEEGTVFTENYWLSHWLYISEHEEAEIWRRAIDLDRPGDASQGQPEQHEAQSQATTKQDTRHRLERDKGSLASQYAEAGLPEDMSETASTISERSFNTRYKSTTRKMIHRRASIEMFKRIQTNNLKVEKRIEISRSSVGEFGFRIHGSRPVVVSAIERGTSAETCGLQVGDLIYAINDTNILDMAHSDVVRLAHEAGSSALILDLIPTNDFLGTTRYNRDLNKRFESTVSSYLMRLSPSTAQPLLIELQDKMSTSGRGASSQQRAIELNKVMRLAWRPRYFVLRSDNCLYWYRSPDDLVEPLGGLNLQGFSATLTDEFSEPDYVIRLVKYGGQPHYIGSNNMCDIQTWVDAINRAATEANQSDPYMKHTLILARCKPNHIQDPDCSGWLYKFSHKSGGGAHWRAAYFVLKDACLYLFRHQKSDLVDQASAVYYLHGYRVRSKHIEHKKHTFELIPPNRKTIKPMFLMASNEIDKKRWIAALEYSIDRWIEIN